MYFANMYCKLPAELVNLVAECVNDEHNPEFVVWILNFRLVDKFCNSLFEQKRPTQKQIPENWTHMWETISPAFFDTNTAKSRVYLLSKRVTILVPQSHALWKLLSSEVECITLYPHQTLEVNIEDTSQGHIVRLGNEDGFISWPPLGYVQTSGFLAVLLKQGLLPIQKIHSWVWNDWEYYCEKGYGKFGRRYVGCYSKLPKEIIKLVVESGSNARFRGTETIAWILTFRQVDKYCNSLLASSCEAPTIDPKCTFDSLWESMAKGSYFGFCDVHTLKAQSLLVFVETGDNIVMSIPSYHPLWEMLLKEEGNFFSEEGELTPIEKYLLGEKNSDDLVVEIIIEKKSCRSYNVGLYVADDDEIYVDSHINKSRRELFPMTFRDSTAELLAFLMRGGICPKQRDTWSWIWKGKMFSFNKGLGKFENVSL